MNNSSISRWTRPSTPEEQQYYSTHSSERNMYGYAATALQILHAAIDFAYMRILVGWGIARFLGEDSVFIDIIAITAILVLHAILRVSWSTYWYDKLDDRTETDSSIWLPLIVAAIIVAVGFQGSQKMMHSMIGGPEMMSDSSLNASTNAAITTNAASNAADIAEIKSAYADRIKGIKRKYNAQISQYNRKALTDADRQYIRTKVAPIQREMEAELSQIEAEKTEKILQLTNSKINSDQSVRSRTDTILRKMAALNAAELDRVEQERRSVGQYAWFVSLFLVIVIMYILYKRVRINAKSGIFPVRDFTMMQEHGSVIERIITAFTDAMSRRGYAFGTWLHKFLSPAKMDDLDTRLIVKESTYQDRKSHKGITREEAIKKVLQKMDRDGVALYPNEFEDEVQKAITQNGTYFDTPLKKE